MESTQQKPRTLRQALNRGGKSDTVSDGPRRPSDFVSRRSRSLAKHCKMCEAGLYEQA